MCISLASRGDMLLLVTPCVVLITQLIPRITFQVLVLWPRILTPMRRLELGYALNRGNPADSTSILFLHGNDNVVPQSLVLGA